MEIRFADVEDKIKVKEMWSYCFGDKDPFLSWYFQEKYSAANTLVVYEDSVPVSSLQMLPYKLNFHGKVIDISYIVGAATLPEARGKRYMEALLKKSIEVMHKRGNIINILLPFQYDFYRKYGWETCYYHKFYKIEMPDLKPLTKKYGKLRPVNIDSDMDAIMKIYAKFIADKNGSIVRSDKDWRSIYTDHSFEGGAAYLVEGEEGVPEGYILYSIHSGVFNIHEMGYTNREAYRGLLWFVFSHSAQAQKITWKAPMDDMAFVLLSEPRRDIVLSPFVMARVLDVEKILELLCGIIEVPDISIKVQDPLAVWNTGTFNICCGKIANEGNRQAGLECSMNTFSQLVMGFISPVQAYHLGMLQAQSMKDIEKANKLFPLCNNFINDYY